MVRSDPERQLFLPFEEEEPQQSDVSSAISARRDAFASPFFLCRTFKKQPPEFLTPENLKIAERKKKKKPSD